MGNPQTNYPSMQDVEEGAIERNNINPNELPPVNIPMTANIDNNIQGASEGKIICCCDTRQVNK